VAKTLSPSAILSRVLTALALLAASVAWAGFVFLRTVGDPQRSSRVARAVLDDPAARAEVARQLSGAVVGAVEAAGLPAGDPRLAGMLDAMLTDKRLTDALLEVVSSAHATALGETPTRPTRLDSGVVTLVLRDQLAALDPRLAAAVPEIATDPIELPTVEVPGIGSARSVLADAVGPLAIVALVGAGAAFALGGRARVLRRVGVWAVGAGLLWVVVPRLAVWAAERWLIDLAATARAVVEATSAGVTSAATGLVVLGVGCWWGGFVWDRAVRSWAVAPRPTAAARPQR